MKTKTTIILLIFLVLLSTFVSAATAKNSWEGYVYIYNSTATISNSSLAERGTVVNAYVNGVWASSTTTGKATDLGINLPPGFYVLTLECDSDTPDNITFKVWGINVSGINASAQRCAAGTVPHYGFNLTMVAQADGASCTYTQSCNGTYCVHNVCRSASTYCGDGYCDTGESCSADNSGCSSGYSCTNGCQVTAAAAAAGGGGGGGAVVAGVSETQSLNSISSGATGTFDFEKSADLGVYQVKMTVAKEESYPKVTVKESSAPVDAPLAISTALGNIYKYISITSTVPDDEISKVSIKFKIPKSWYTDKGLDPATTKLKKYKTGDWISLTTRQIGADSDYYYFESESTGFTTYAITAEKAKVVEKPKVEEKPPVVEEKPPVAEEKKPVVEKVPIKPIIQILAVVIVLIVLLVIAYYVYTKKRL